MRLPNFFILGAPKCGTTSLARWLGEHPDVFIPELKEPHYYCTDLQHRIIREEEKYRRLFRGAGTCRAIGEASTWYLYSRVAVHNIESQVPHARYIVLVRNPVDMAISLFWHNRRSLYEKCTTFEEAWQLQDRRKREPQLLSSCHEPAFLQYKEACSLRNMAQRLTVTVDANRVLFLPFEQLVAQPAKAYQTVLDFLELSDDRRVDFPAHNVGSDIRSRRFQQLIRIGGLLKNRLGVYRSFGTSRLNAMGLKRPVIEPAVIEAVTRDLEHQYPAEFLRPV